MSSKRSKAIFALVVIPCGAVIVGIATCAWQDHRRARAYEALVPDTGTVMVLKQFGRPTEVRPCSTFSPQWDAKPLQVQLAHCIQEYWYFSKISLQQWVIGFDKDGRAMTKYYLSSP
jgi:hypothetical protein